MLSKILPLLRDNNLLSLAEGIDPKILSPIVHQKIQNIIDQVSSQQTLDGGFSLWPSEKISQPWVSAYATYVLSKAAISGYAVSPSVLKKAISYLQISVDLDSSKWKWYENERPGFALALYVLAKNKKNSILHLDSISKNLNLPMEQISEGFGYENLFLLAMTARLNKNSSLLSQMINNKKLANKIFSKSYNDKPFSSQNFWSPLRLDGLRLSILLDDWPEHEAIKELTKRIDSRLSQPKSFFNTQDLSWALLAISKNLATHKTDKAKLKNIQLKLNGKVFNPIYEVHDNPVWFLTGENLISSSFQFKGQTKSNLAFHTKVSGYTMSPPPSLSPITVERAYLLPDGREADETELKIGDLILVELRIFNPRSNKLQNVALTDKLPASLAIDSPNAYSEGSSWMNKNILKITHYDLFENQIQIFTDISEREKYYYYQVRAVAAGKFKNASAKIELMYTPEFFDFSSETAIGVSP